MNNGPETRVWHAISATEALSALASDAVLGLSSEEAGARLARLGENRLREAVPRPLWRKFLDQRATCRPSSSCRGSRT